MLLHHLLTCIIPSEKSAVIFIFVLAHYNMSLLLPTPRLLAAFVIFLFIVMVEQFEYDVLLHNFFLFVFFASASLSFLLCGLMVFYQIWKSFGYNFFKYFFFLFLFLSPLLQQLHTGILNCLTVYF